jgi:hypothetical protein
MTSPITLIPGDRVLFDGHEWSVLLTLRGEQRDDSPVHIWRGDGLLGVIDLVRLRGELTPIPRAAP